MISNNQFIDQNEFTMHLQKEKENIPLKVAELPQVTVYLGV